MTHTNDFCPISAKKIIVRRNSRGFAPSLPRRSLEGKAVFHLTFWRQKLASFPLLAPIARTLLSVLATSVKSDRLFSKTTLIYHNRIVLDSSGNMRRSACSLPRTPFLASGEKDLSLPLEKDLSLSPSKAARSLHTTLTFPPLYYRCIERLSTMWCTPVHGRRIEGFVHLREFRTAIGQLCQAPGGVSSISAVFVPSLRKCHPSMGAKLVENDVSVMDMSFQRCGTPGSSSNSVSSLRCP